MSLNLHDLERGVGTDLMRRPFFTSIINASLLRFFVETVYVSDEDPADPEDVEIIPTAEAKKKWLQDRTIEKGLASTIFILTLLVQVIGYAETAGWVVIALVFKVIRLPKVYAFEKLILDMTAVLLRVSVRHIRKSVRFQTRRGQRVPQLEATRRGYGLLVITIISAKGTLTREALAVLRITRYMNRGTVGYWTDGCVTLAGRNEDLARGLCNLEQEQGQGPCTVELGWHRDVVEGTNFNLRVIFTREKLTRVDSPVKAAGRRVVVVELHAELRSADLRLVGRYLDQFAAVCEASARGRRSFNGKRTLIYFVGIALGAALILFYEEFANWVRPSPDVLTLAIGAFTLWMTVGKSAALGKVEELTEYTVHGRENILLAFHGLAKVADRVGRTTWIPEVRREEDHSPVRESLQVDGSISMLEAAVCLNIFDHFGYLVRWKGPRLWMERYFVRMRDLGVGEVTQVKRIRNMAQLESCPAGLDVGRIG